jgi:hypothetical protein
MPVKKLAIKLLIAVGLAYMVLGVVYEFRAKKAADYYSSHPEHLLYVLAIAVAGGAAAFVFCRLSPRVQRGAKLLALGSAAVFSSLYLGWAVLWVIPSISLLLRLDPDCRGPIGLLVFLLVMTAASVAMFWYLFYRMLKRG